MNLLVFTKYSYEGPSSRYRFYNYQNSFLENNIEMDIKPLFDKHYFNTMCKWHKMFVVFISYVKRVFFISQLVLFPKKYDVVLLEYELLPYFPAWFEYLFAKRGVRYIVDYDDAIFHKYDNHQNIIVQQIIGNKIAKVMAYAQTVIVCNLYLETYARQYNKNIVTIPTVVQLEKYIEKMKNAQEKDGDTFTIGWIGSWTTGVYVLDVLPQMKAFVKKYENVRFHLVGFDAKLLSEGQKKEAHIEVIAWSDESEIDEILDFDVGMMPLPDDAWSKGKCGFKLVQYMSCKKPVIASAVGVNCTLVKEGINGLLITDASEWFNAFEKLYLDKELRDKMAQNNFKKIEKEYNNTIHSQRYVDLLQNSLKV